MNIKRINLFLFTLITLLFSSHSFAQNENSLLWKISGKDLENPSYIFGTIHMICEEDYFFTEQFENAINQSKAIITEINFANMSEMMQMQQAMQTDIPLKDRITKKQYQKLATLLKSKLNMDIANFNNVSISGIASIITLKSFPCENLKMYEIELVQKAIQNNKSLNGLETITKQMQIMENHMDIKASIKMLKELGTKNDSNKEMIALYKQQNIDSLLNLIKKSSYMNPTVYDDFVVKRNNNWIEKMTTFMNENPTFFAVGAAHLGSKDGILDLLRQEGYQVEAVK